MSFCTAINCMDGRVQAPVIEYLRERFKVEYVDKITEPGPVAILSADPESDASRSIFARVDISLEAHDSCGIAVVAHHDCAGNPVPEAEQRRQLQQSVAAVASRYPGAEVIGLWVDNTWSVREIDVHQFDVDQQR